MVDGVALRSPDDLLQLQVDALGEAQAAKVGHEGNGLPHLPVGGLHLLGQKLLEDHLVKYCSLVLVILLSTFLAPKWPLAALGTILRGQKSLELLKNPSKGPIMCFSRKKKKIIPHL